jgi:hypothetical protein
LKHLILQPSAGAPPHRVKFVAQIEMVPIGQQAFAMMQLGLPLLPPIGAQSSAYYQANKCD